MLLAAGETSKISCRRLFLGNGAELTSADQLRDDDVVYCSEGEPFRRPTIRYDESPVPTPAAAERHDWVTLNVGGRLFATTRSTLTKDSTSMLARMFGSGDSGGGIVDSSAWRSTTDESGAFLIDRSATYFEPLLDFLRHGKLILNEGVKAAGVLEEARFFGITSAIELLEGLVRDEELVEQGVMSRSEFLRHLLVVPPASSLRCQGICLEKSNLSRLDLRRINFKFANLRGCDLRLADLSDCLLQRADLTGANLDGATLTGAKMARVCLESASLCNCEFEDSTGSVAANLEGANLKGAVFDGSRMDRVNLRVACMKKASLKNCSLRSAILAGTDLEDCDLSGCDLGEANLRGANVVGAIFNEMANAIHMSQTLPSHVRGVTYN